MLLAVAGYCGGQLVHRDRAPPPRTTPGLIEPQYYVADPPAGSACTWPSRRPDGRDPADFADDDEAELWATPDASATTGSWFVISQGPQHSTGRNSYRRSSTDIEVVFEHDPASGRRDCRSPRMAIDMAITSFGWIDRQLVRLVKSVNVDDSTIRFSDGFFTSDHKRVLQADPARAVFGLPVARVGYATGLPAELAQTLHDHRRRRQRAGRGASRSFALTNTTAVQRRCPARDRRSTGRRIHRSPSPNGTTAIG